MSLVEIPDDAGDLFPCVEHDGHIFPTFEPVDIIENLSSIDIRDDDIIICAYPKSGESIYPTTS